MLLFFSSFWFLFMLLRSFSSISLFYSHLIYWIVLFSNLIPLSHILSHILCFLSYVALQRCIQSLNFCYLSFSFCSHFLQIAYLYCSPAFKFFLIPLHLCLVPVPQLIYFIVSFPSSLPYFICLLRKIKETVFLEWQRHKQNNCTFEKKTCFFSQKWQTLSKYCHNILQKKGEK